MKMEVNEFKKIIQGTDEERLQQIIRQAIQEDRAFICVLMSEEIPFSYFTKSPEGFYQVDVLGFRLTWDYSEEYKGTEPRRRIRSGIKYQMKIISCNKI